MANFDYCLHRNQTYQVRSNFVPQSPIHIIYALGHTFLLKNFSDHHFDNFDLKEKLVGQ